MSGRFVVSKIPKPVLKATRSNQSPKGTKGRSRAKGSNGKQGLKVSSSSTIDDHLETRILENHEGRVLNGLEVMWRQNVMCDATLVVGESRLRAHKVVLSSCADYFHSVFCHAESNGNQLDQSGEADVVVRLEGVTVETMETILECMYTGRLQLSEPSIRELLAASSYLNFFLIEEACGDFLRRRLSTANCLRMLNIASTYNLNDLMEEALVIAAANFLEVAQGPDYHELGVEEVVAYLSRDDLAASSELLVFIRALAWIDHSRVDRLQYAADILAEVRLPLVPPSDIVDHVETVDFLMAIPECAKLVKEALHYHCLPARQSLLQTSRTVPRSKAKVEVILATGGAPRLKADPVSTDVKFYNPATGAWGHLTSLQQPRHHHAVATLGGFLYVAGGEETNDQRSPLNSAFRYDPRTNTWIQIASMNNRRESFQMVVLNGFIYAVGGRVDRDVSLAEVEQYNPATDQWQVVAPLSAARRSVALAAHGGLLYAMGGSGYKRISSKVERYNPATNKWEGRRNLYTPRFFAMLVPVEQGLFLFGGATLNPSGDVICAKKVEYYIPSTDTWVSVSPMLQPRAEFGCAILSTKIYIVGGYSWDNNERLSSVEVYDTEADTWSWATSFEKPYTGLGCCSLALYKLPQCEESPMDPLRAGDQALGEGEDGELSPRKALSVS